MLRLIANDDDRSFLLDRARHELACRRKRTEQFGNLLFSDPAWDILLILYINDDACTAVELAKVVDFTAASRGTVTRWLKCFVERGLARPANAPQEAGPLSVRLSAAARDRMDAYFLNTQADR